MVNVIPWSLVHRFSILSKILFFSGCGLSEWQSSVEFNNAIGRSYDADPASIVHCQ